MSGRFDDILARGVVTVADGSKKMRVVQVRLLADEIRDDLEHVEPYGFTSEPKDDGAPEAFALFFGGDRSHGVVFCVADRRFRLKNLAPGEVALYDDIGQKVHLTRSGIVVETPGKLEAKVGKDATVTVGGKATVKAASAEIDAPKTKITGDLLVVGSITGTGGLAVSGGSGATVQGSLSTTGSMNAGGDVKAGGISLQGHIHPGDSGGKTGKPE